MMDESLKVWLIEINASPALTHSTEEDLHLKKNMINDLMNVVVPPYWLKNRSYVGTDTCKEKKVGMFTMIYDESQSRTYRTNNYLKKFSGQMQKAFGRGNTSKKI